MSYTKSIFEKYLFKNKTEDEIDLDSRYDQLLQCDISECEDYQDIIDGECYE